MCIAVGMDQVHGSYVNLGRISTKKFRETVDYLLNCIDVQFYFCNSTICIWTLKSGCEPLTVGEIIINIVE